MITSAEIRDIATRSGLQPHVVEKDYVLGWLLAGINWHENIRETWVFKGGTCLKKCYFDTYRFSEDLDFTLINEEQISKEFLIQTFTDISEWIYEQSGIQVFVDRLRFDILTNPRGNISCQGRIYYQGPVSPKAKNQTPRIKLDLTADELIAEPPELKSVFHNYSDLPDGGIQINAYSYIEVFAEKTRALAERTRPRDLYDVVNLYRRPESKNLVDDIRQTLSKKCHFKKIDFPQLEILIQHKEACESGWEDQLSHQLPTLPAFEVFWKALSEFFSWLSNGISPDLNRLGAGNKHHTFVRPIDVKTHFRGAQSNFLDYIQFASANRLCLEMNYRKENGVIDTYLIEPYALYRTSEDNLLIRAIKHETDQPRSFRVDRIITLKTSSIPFEPKYETTIIPNSLSETLDYPKNEAQLQSNNVKPVIKLRKFKPKSQLKYTFQCPICKKHFTRSKFDAKLNSHKNKKGQTCYGTMGIYKTTKYK